MFSSREFPVKFQQIKLYFCDTKYQLRRPHTPKGSRYVIVLLYKIKVIKTKTHKNLIILITLITLITFPPISFLSIPTYRGRLKDFCFLSLLQSHIYLKQENKSLARHI